MKKSLTILFFAIAVTLPAAAQQMLVEKSGYENEILSRENLKQITFEDATVVIEQIDGKVSNTSMDDISRIYFGDFNSIDNISHGKELLEYVSSDEIAVNCTAGTVVTIYSVTGMQVMSVRLDADGGHISIAGLAQGIYIVKAEERTAKFVRR